MAEMSPLRRRMIEDMTDRNLSPATQRSYVHAVAKFSRYFGRSPERLALEDVRAFQVQRRVPAHLTHCQAYKPASAYCSSAILHTSNVLAEIPPFRQALVHL
jgi:hypothetical protein